MTTQTAKKTQATLGIGARLSVAAFLSDARRRKA
jgi:hypothetical protein